MNSLDSPKISIIVPVYNVKKYLPRCLDSIMNQTFRDWECLVIDDGSTDSSGNICDEYAIKDNRFKVIHKENGGVSSARNVGLDAAIGNYITFIDSDDYVSESYVKNLYDGLLNVDLSVSFSIYSGKKIEKRELYLSGDLDRCDFSILFTDYDFAWHTSPWAKMYRKSIINEARLHFDNKLKIGEDLCFLYSYILCSNKIHLSSETDYHYYYDNSGSLTKMAYSLDSELYTYGQISNLIIKVIRDLSLPPSAVQQIMWTYATYCRRVLNALYANNVNKEHRLSTLNHIDIDAYCRYINSSSIIERLYVKILMHKNYVMYDTIRVMIKKIRRWTIQR